ncbi:MAG: DegV family protein, partial [Fervidobacterium pennivorans]
EYLSEHYEKTYVLSVSSLLSGTYNLFSTTASKYENIKVFDSKSVSIQNTYIFERMVMDILSGKEIQEDDIISYKDDSLFLISVFDLTQLHKSGRIGKVTSILGKIMHVKPILTVERTGEVGLLAKALSSSKLLSYLDGYVLTFIKKLLQREVHQKEENVPKIINNIDKLNIFDGELNSIIEDIEKMFSIYAAVGSESYKDFVYNIASKYGIKPMFLDIGPAVTVHVGLHGFGILIAKKVK